MHGQDLVCFLGQMTRDRIHFEVALLASVLLHVTAVASFQYREMLARVTVRTPLARLINAWEASHPAASAPAMQEPEMQTLTFIEAPRTFMETTADQVTGEKPTDTKYYSDKATVAVNRVCPQTTDSPGAGTRSMWVIMRPAIVSTVGTRGSCGYSR